MGGWERGREGGLREYKLCCVLYCAAVVRRQVCAADDGLSSLMALLKPDGQLITISSKFPFFPRISISQVSVSDCMLTKPLLSVSLYSYKTILLPHMYIPCLGLVLTEESVTVEHAAAIFSHMAREYSTKTQLLSLSAHRLLLPLITGADPNIQRYSLESVCQLVELHQARRAVAEEGGEERDIHTYPNRALAIASSSIYFVTHGKFYGNACIILRKLVEAQMSV